MEFASTIVVHNIPDLYNQKCKLFDQYDYAFDHTMVVVRRQILHSGTRIYIILLSMLATVYHTALFHLPCQCEIDEFHISILQVD